MSDIDKLRAFAQAILEGWPEVPQWDGFDLQEIAVKHGLLEPITATESCGEGCNCVEYGEWPIECFRFTALLKGAACTWCEQGIAADHNGNHWPHGVMATWQPCKALNRRPE